MYRWVWIDKRESIKGWAWRGGPVVHWGTSRGWRKTGSSGDRRIATAASHCLQIQWAVSGSPCLGQHVEGRAPHLYVTWSSSPINHEPIRSGLEWAFTVHRPDLASNLEHRSVLKVHLNSLFFSHTHVRVHTDETACTSRHVHALASYKETRKGRKGRRDRKQGQRPDKALNPPSRGK